MICHLWEPTLLSLLHDDTALLWVKVVQDPKGPDIENIYVMELQ